MQYQHLVKYNKQKKKKKAKQMQWKRHSNYHLAAMTEQLTTAQKQNKKQKNYDAHTLSCTQALT